MRRPLVISFLAALIAIGVLAVSVGPSTASGAAPAIICPLGGAIGTCCGPPINAPDATAVLPCCTGGAFCCPGTAVCATPMITSTPNPSVAGSAVTVSGQITGATAGTVVALWQELPGQTSFQQIGSTTTDASGVYKLRRPGSQVKTDRAWYVASAGAKSLTIDQVVKAKVTVSARGSKLSGAHKITLTGKVDPSHSGQRVLLEQRIGGTWRVLGHVRLSQKSRYAITHHWARAGVVNLRISLAADKQNAASLSPVATVTLS